MQYRDDSLIPLPPPDYIGPFYDPNNNFNGNENNDNDLEKKFINLQFGLENIFDEKSKFDRYGLSLIIDKALYKPGDTVYIAGFVLGVFDFHPPSISSNEHPPKSFNIDITGPKGDVVHSTTSSYDASLGLLESRYQLPADIAGGEYLIKVKMQQDFGGGRVMKIAPAERKFEVIGVAKSNPKMKKELIFQKKSYGPKDVVHAVVKCDHKSALISQAIARIDGEVVFTLDPAPIQIDSYTGSATITFQIPKEIKDGQGSLSVTLSDGAIVETITKTIPIVLQNIDIHVYPESGVAIDGLNTRLYIEATNSLKEPADFYGNIIILDEREDKNFVAAIATNHEGRGVSASFKVEKGKKYGIQIQSPSSLEGKIIDIDAQLARDTRPLLDKADKGGGVIIALKKAYKIDESITFDVQTAYEGKFILRLFKKEKSIGKYEVLMKEKQSSVQVAFDSIPSEYYGVLRATLFLDDDLTPIAERLIFRHPLKVLKVSIDASAVADTTIPANSQLNSFKESESAIVMPADAVEVRISTYLQTLGDDDGEEEPVSAMLNVIVTDDSLAASSIDKRRMPPRLPSAIMLEPEVDHLEDADVYTTGTKDGDVAVDLLLGTQGWRRFAYERVSSYHDANEPKERIERMFGIQFNQEMVMYDVAMPMMMMMAKFAAPAEERIFDEEAEMNDEAPPMDNNENANDNNNGEGVALNRDIMPQMGLRMKMPPAKPTYERIYAHPQRKFSRLDLESEDGIMRSDFTDTVYFAPGIKTTCNNANKMCSSRVRFGLSDSITTFRVLVDGYSLNGKKGHTFLGYNSYDIMAKLPLESDFLLPSFLMSGDKPLVPLLISRSDSSNPNDVDLKFKIESSSLGSAKDSDVLETVSGKLSSSLTFSKRQSSIRAYVPFTASSETSGTSSVVVSAAIKPTSTRPARDSSKKSVAIKMGGFPVSSSKSGLLSNSDAQSLAFTLPDDFVKGSLRVSVKAFTSPIGQLNEAIEALISEPCGCFEQTSSTTYPLVMALRYLNTHSNSNPTLIARAKEMLSIGYKKLVSYESKDGGFEWFGESPGHEALTAYGVIQFATMASKDVGMTDLVDMAMFERTRKWLIARRDGNGGFKRNPKSLDSFGAAPDDTTNAYITWALVRAGILIKGDDSLNKEVTTALANAKSEMSKADGKGDSYIIALGALTMFDVAKDTPANREEGMVLCKYLASKQESNGMVQGAANSITRSFGESLSIEATALTSMAWMHARDDSFAVNIRSAIEWLSSQCKNGRFSSTQATALTLQAIVEYDEYFSSHLKPGYLEIEVNGKIVEKVRFGDNDKSSSETTTTANQPTLRTEKPCENGMVWNDCGSACTPTCSQPNIPCTLQCVPRCQCPPEKSLWTGAKCVAEMECANEKPAIRDDGVILFSEEKILAETFTSVGKENKIIVKMTLDEKGSDNASKIPFSMYVEHSAIKPKNAEKCPIELSTTFTTDKKGQNKMKEGDVATITATIKNVLIDTETSKPKAVPMTVAIIGIPAGLEVRSDKLRELKQEGTISFYEVFPGQVNIYWRALKEGAVVSVPIEVSALTPGKYKSQSSRAYVYYNDENKYWTDGIEVDIAPALVDKQGHPMLWDD